jgi:hypothetical protein
LEKYDGEEVGDKIIVFGTIFVLCSLYLNRIKTLYIYL